LGKERKLLPVKVKECKLHGLKKAIIYIDLTGLSEEAAKERLIKGVKSGERPKKKTPFPGTIAKTQTRQPKFPGSLPEIWNLPFSRNHKFHWPRADPRGTQCCP
jgi:hypothetical protein